MVMQISYPTPATINYRHIYWNNNRRHQHSCPIIDHFINATMVRWATVRKNQCTETSIWQRQVEDNVFVRIIIEIFRTQCDLLMNHIIFQCIVWTISVHHHHRHHIRIHIVTNSEDRGRRFLILRRSNYPRNIKQYGIES